MCALSQGYNMEHANFSFHLQALISKCRSGSTSLVVYSAASRTNLPKWRQSSLRSSEMLEHTSGSRASMLWSSQRAPSGGVVLLAACAFASVRNGQLLRHQWIARCRIYRWAVEWETPFQIPDTNAPTPPRPRSQLGLWPPWG